ncbi:hypothetical protein [Sedimentibacter saalensis]|uniref:Uncharacterized protein n=1 Tax=Sedimentibacter saalensis TaxID=130788 RepID=A0A562JH43_9FIRM|nr:hypothetical protein [Sedimentibacter saalensis]TWH82572.1 hypothetical protein LY60_00873 [Sedimentibacter saalensis]
MYIIKTKKDLDIIRKAKVIKDYFLDFIEINFSHQFEILNDDENITIEEFSLNNDGAFVLLETSDNVRRLEEIGLDPNSGLLNTAPEAIRTIIIGNKKLYEVLVLCNNQYALYIYVPEEIVDCEMLEWIDKNK